MAVGCFFGDDAVFGKLPAQFVDNQLAGIAIGARYGIVCTFPFNLIVAAVELHYLPAGFARYATGDFQLLLQVEASC
jgi:hypothetical protein